MPIEPQPVEVIASTNIALVKYWGKRDLRGNFPAVGSLSLTLKEFTTRTAIHASEASEDQFFLNDKPMERKEKERVETLLRMIPPKKRIPIRFESWNDFPTASGLASSASGGAAAVLAVDSFFRMNWSPSRIAMLALRFSGSAPRSLAGGFVCLEPDPLRKRIRIRPLSSPLLEDIRVVVVQCAEGPKEVLSRDAMELSRKTSPYYRAWIATHSSDLKVVRDALKDGNWDELLSTMEHNTLKMHALTLTSKPPVIYWTPATLAVLHLVWEKRSQGWRGGFTMDAGPHVKIFTDARTAERWADAVRDLPGVARVFIASPGGPPRISTGGKEWVWDGFSN
jgi:diphosphomevalonate decarboxylase